MIVIKLIPHAVSWAVIALFLVRGFHAGRLMVIISGSGGFALGALGALVLFRLLPPESAFGIIRGGLGVSLLLLWGVAVMAAYRPFWKRTTYFEGTGFTVMCACLAGCMAGAVSASRLSGSGTSLAPYLALILVGGALASYAGAVEKRIPEWFIVGGPSLAAVVVALLLYGSSLSLRLDLFAPLTMKVMKFAHDFVHQFMESMLIPDHVFIRSNLWKYIGVLFGKEIGFWGALVIWFTPLLLIVYAIQFEPLPSVAHIRQGAERRRLLAVFIHIRRYRLIPALLAVLVLTAAVYRSCVPSVEYWDPKPIVVTATPVGDIFIPRKGDIDLEDGKLHKYLFRQGGKEARFFIIMGPSGKLTVVLDACAICKPDGYGQAEGTVICYYCKTLIPLDTVGRSGGCNPVPLAFSEKDDGVHINAVTLMNEWDNTVQTTTKVKGAGK